MRSDLIGVVALGALLLFPPKNCLADMGMKAVQVSAKAIRYARPPIQAGAKIAVVGEAVDLANAQATFGALSYKVVADNDPDAFATFVSNDEDAKAAGPHTLTIGPVPCVESNACVLAIETSPTVLIYLSKVAAGRVGITFDSNFILMAITK